MKTNIARLMDMIIGAIVGATACGKSSIAIQVAKKLGCEIISADSRQIYKGFRIGTAQPSEVEKEGIPHHFMDFVDPTESYSVGRYLREVTELVQKCPEKSFIVVCGTGMYVNALLNGISKLPESSPELRARLEQIRVRRGLGFLYKWAQRVDPLGGQKLNSQDTQRILRALEIFLQTKIPWSVHLSRCEGGLGPFPVIWLDREREDLYNRIDSRVLEMMELGWVKEVRTCMYAYPSGGQAFESLGYCQIRSFLKGEIEWEGITQEIQRDTRRFAKRQRTWFRHQIESGLIELNIGNINTSIDRIYDIILAKSAN